MSNDLIHRYADIVGLRIAKVNPYDDNTVAYALYEVGLLRAIIAQCILVDSKMLSVLDKTIDSIVESRVENPPEKTPYIRHDGR